MPDLRYQRIVLGVATVAMAATAIWLNVVDPTAGERNAAIASGSVRMTAVLAILWVALPDARKSGPAFWLFIVAAIVAFGLLMGRGGKNSLRIIVPALAVLAVLGFLRRFTAAQRSNDSTHRRER